jgi:carbamoylphosphate synthase small subunit
MGTEMAMREKTAIIPDTPDDPIDFRTELRQLVDQLNVDTILTGWGAGVQIITTSAKGAQTYLLVLDSQKKNIRVTGFKKTLLAQAQQQYLEIEAANADNPWVQTVLVSVDSVAALRRAYPNYYLDAVAFSRAVEQAIA